MKRNENAGVYKPVIKNAAIGARVTAKLKRELEKEAKARGLTLSEYVCLVIEERRGD